MNSTYILLLIVMWAVVIFSLSLPFIFGGQMYPTITVTTSELNNAFDNAIGDNNALSVDSVNPNELSDYIADLSPPPVPPSILPRGVSQVSRPLNLNQRRIRLNK